MQGFPLLRHCFILFWPYYTHHMIITHGKTRQGKIWILVQLNLLKIPSFVCIFVFVQLNRLDLEYAV